MGHQTMQATENLADDRGAAGVSGGFSVAVRNLAVCRGDRCLFRGLGFSFGAGELIQVAGENGSGKTSLLRVMAGLATPAEGEVVWNDVPIRELGDEYLAQMAYLGHLDGVKDDLTGEENLRMASALSSGEVSDEAIRAALYSLGLWGRERLPARLLSQGQHRRLALCRLMLAKRRLWILDEPYTALDVRGVETVQETIGRHLDGGGSVLITSHQPVDVRGFVCRKIQLH